MTRNKNTSGGGKKTNENGLSFERITDLITLFESLGFQIEKTKFGTRVTSGSSSGLIFSKHDLYRWLKIEKSIDWENRISGKMLPDEAILIGNTIHIIEKKFQETSGSADEKIQTGPVKVIKYNKLFQGLGFNVEFTYILSDWFRAKKYTTDLEVISDLGCKHYFGEIPVSMFVF